MKRHEKLSFDESIALCKLTDRNKRIACIEARIAHVDHNEDRGGTINYGDRVVTYDNHPFYGDEQKRDLALAVLILNMADRGIKCVATGQYPPRGYLGAGYTKTLVFEGEPKMVLKALAEEWQPLVGITFGRVDYRGNEIPKAAPPPATNAPFSHLQEMFGEFFAQGCSKSSMG